MSAMCRVQSRCQTVERTQARSEDFYTRVVRALLHTRLFMKFKLSCTVFDKVTSWPQLMSNLLAVPACLQCCF